MSKALAEIHALEAGAKPTAIVPRTVEETFRLAQYVCASDLKPKDVRGPEDAVMRIMLGLELGVSPMQALQNISNINGRPAVWGDLALALVKGSGLLEGIKETIEGKDDDRVAVCSVKRKGDSVWTKRTFSVADAKTAGLWQKTGSHGQPTPWVTYPERMLQMRARAFALRDVFPDVLKGLAIREEAQDIPPEPIDVTPDPMENPPPPRVVLGIDKGAEDLPAVAIAKQGENSQVEIVDVATGDEARKIIEAEDYPELPPELDRRNGGAEGATFEATAYTETAEMSEEQMELIARDVKAKTAKLNEEETEEEDGGLSEDEFADLVRASNV